MIFNNNFFHFKLSVILFRMKGLSELIPAFRHLICSESGRLMHRTALGGTSPVYNFCEKAILTELPKKKSITIELKFMIDHKKYYYSDIQQLLFLCRCFRERVFEATL